MSAMDDDDAGVGDNEDEIEIDPALALAETVAFVLAMVLTSLDLSTGIAGWRRELVRERFGALPITSIVGAFVFAFVFVTRCRFCCCRFAAFGTDMESLEFEYIFELSAVVVVVEGAILALIFESSSSRLRLVLLCGGIMVATQAGGAGVSACAPRSSGMVEVFVVGSGFLVLSICACACSSRQSSSP